MQRADLVLVNPTSHDHMVAELSLSLSAIEPPVWTGLTASFIRQKGFSVQIIDADAEGWDSKHTAEKIMEYNPLLVGIGAFGGNPSASSTPKMVAASKTLNALKEKASDVKTVFYGIHPSALPERTLKEEKVDFVCRGENFHTVFQLLKVLKSGNKPADYKIEGLGYIKDGKIILNGWGKLIQNLDELPFVAWDLLPMNKYRAHNWHCFGRLNQRQPYAAIYTSLGCPFNCIYCNIHALYDGKPGIRFRSIKNVVEEIDFLVKTYGIKNIKILDELFVLKEERVIEFCNLLIKRDYDLNFWAYARIDTVNENILKKMRQASINWLAFGIESANMKVRKKVIKGQFSQDTIKKAIQMTHDAGIYIVANFIFGLPEDNLESMQETFELAKELNCEYTNFYVAMAYPGSKLYTDALNSGIELPRTWAGYAQFSEETVPLSTKYLPNSEILRFRDRAFDEYHSSIGYLKMIEDKFGLETVEHIRNMLKYKIDRKLLEVN